MARVSSGLDGVPRPIEPCIGCGKEMERGGYWCGGGDVSLCTSCARAGASQLAAVLADALVDGGCDACGAERALGRFEAHFYRALAKALGRPRCE